MISWKQFGAGVFLFVVLGKAAETPFSSAGFVPKVTPLEQRETVTSNPAPELPPIKSEKLVLPEPDLPIPEIPPVFEIPLAPLKVDIRAPRDALVGDLVDITTDIDGDPSDITWDVEPPVEGLRILDGGRKAVFANRDAGVYVFFVSIADKRGRVAHDKYVLEMLAQPPENPISGTTIANLQADVPLIDYVRAFLSSVKSSSRNQETRIVAGTFRLQANAIRSGRVVQDPLRVMEAATETALGPAAFQGWIRYFEDTRAYIVKLQEVGAMTQDVNDYANAWDNFAATLDEIVAEIERSQ